MSPLIARNAQLTPVDNEQLLPPHRRQSQCPLLLMRQNISLERFYSNVLGLSLIGSTDASKKFGREKRRDGRRRRRRRMTRRCTGGLMAAFELLAMF